MKADDVVKALAAAVPLHTSAFSTALAVSGVAVAGTTVTVSTLTAHDIVDGQRVVLGGLGAHVEIDGATFLRTGSQAMFDTLQDHDFTMSQRDITSGGKTITISGAAEAEFNGTFTLLKVLNRRRLIIAVSDSGPTFLTGAAVVEDANGDIFNGLHSALNVTATTFDYGIPQAYSLPPLIAAATVLTDIRVLSVLDIEQYLNDVYTKQLIDGDQLVVQLGDVVQSKSRNEETDASTSAVGERSHTPVMIQPFAVYIVQNVTDDLTGSAARDRVESEFIPAVFRAVLRAKFDSGFTYSQYRATFTGHGVFAYADNNGKGKAIYVHEVAFEQLTQLCAEDMVGPDDNVAMRDVCFDPIKIDKGTGVLTAEINLDEEPP